MSLLRSLGLVALTFVFLSGCASSVVKQRREQRDKLVQSARMYCEFMNGEQYPDLDVALNLAIANKCDAEKAFSITNYKTPSEIPGIMFCCSVNQKTAMGGKEPPKSKMADHPNWEETGVQPPAAEVSAPPAPGAPEKRTPSASDKPMNSPEAKSSAPSESKAQPADSKPQQPEKRNPQSEKKPQQPKSKEPTKDPDLDE